MKKELDREEAAWEAVLAAAWQESKGADEARAEESAALARRLDAALRAEREARRRRARAWWGWGAVAACAAVLAGMSLRGGRAPVEGGVAAAEAEGEEEITLAEAREAPVAEAFGELEEVLTELAGLDFRYDWDDEDLEVAD